MKQKTPLEREVKRLQKAVKNKKRALEETEHALEDLLERTAVCPVCGRYFEKPHPFPEDGATCPHCGCPRIIVLESR